MGKKTKRFGKRNKKRSSKQRRICGGGGPLANISNVSNVTSVTTPYLSSKPTASFTSQPSASFTSQPSASFTKLKTTALNLPSKVEIKDNMSKIKDTLLRNKDDPIQKSFYNNVIETVSKKYNLTEKENSTLQDYEKTVSTFNETSNEDIDISLALEIVQNIYIDLQNNNSFLLQNVTNSDSSNSNSYGVLYLIIGISLAVVAVVGGGIAFYNSKQYFTPRESPWSEYPNYLKDPFLYTGRVGGPPPKKPLWGYV